MIAYQGETVDFYVSIRLSDGTAPGTITSVQYTIRKLTGIEVSKPQAMTSDGGTRYYASWEIGPQQEADRYFVIVTATVDASAWERVIDDVIVRDINIETLINRMYARSLERR